MVKVASSDGTLLEMIVNPSVAIGLFSDIIITTIALYWVVIKISSHKRNYWDLFTRMPNPQRARNPEDSRTGKMSARVG